VKAGIKVNQRQPWLDEHGRRIPEHQIKMLSRMWDHSTWCAYLETLEKPLEEDLMVKPSEIESVGSDKGYARLVADLERCERLPGGLSQGLKKIVWALGFRERQVLYWLFWGGKSIHQTARFVGVSPTAVIHLKNRALLRLRNALQEALQAA